MINPDPDAVVWVRCAGPAQLAVLPALAARLQSEGEAVRLVATLPAGDAAAHGVAANPVSSKDAMAFLTGLRPIMVLWAGGQLDAAILRATASGQVPLVLVDMAADALSQLRRRLFFGSLRKNIARLHAVFARDEAAAQAFRTAGADPVATIAVGLLEDPPAVLPYDEDDRRTLSEALGNRPVWLATQVRVADVDDLAKAQRHAARRAHRLMLAVIPATPEDAVPIARRFAELGFPVICRTETPTPEDATQIMVGDADDEIGLWLRVSPVTFAGGTLTKSAAQDPFTVAALGSVLVHGPATDPFAARYARLFAARATFPIVGIADLGAAIEDLLAPDKVATMATAGWDVTSRGAETTDRMIRLIRDRLDAVGL